MKFLQNIDQKYLAGVGLVVFLLSIILNSYFDNNQQESFLFSETELETGETVTKGDFNYSQDSATVTEEKIVVHIAGEVRKPGVYEINEGERVIDVLTKAGGETFKADLSAVNLAASPVDGQKIVIPAEGEKVIDNQNQYFFSEDDNLININHVSAEKLQELSGIGSSRAQDIINYRKNNGPFSSKKELTEVPGIAGGILSQIEDEITY